MKTMTAGSEIPFERLVANVRKHATGAVQAGLLHDLDMLEGECRKAEAQRDALARVIMELETDAYGFSDTLKYKAEQILGPDWKDPLKEAVEENDWLWRWARRLVFKEMSVGECISVIKAYPDAPWNKSEGVVK